MQEITSAETVTENMEVQEETPSHVEENRNEDNIINLQNNVESLSSTSEMKENDNLTENTKNDTNGALNDIESPQ